MYNILISGYYGFDNIGDESILRTLVTSLRERIPDCSLTVLSHDPAATREKYGVEAVERMSPLAIARAVRRCDMLISGGGSLLQDVTSSKSLHYYLAIIRFAQLLGKKVFIYSQGIGPIEKDADRRATARALRRADGIVVRDERSAALLAEIGVPAERVVITADPVIRMKKTDKAVGETILRRAGVEVETGVLKAECDALNYVFFHYITTGLPYVVMKYAMTLDGKIATCSGKSKWITCP